MAKVDAKVLWSSAEGFFNSPFEDPCDWVFEISQAVEFMHTALPDGHISELSWNSVKKKTEGKDLPLVPFLGDTVDKATAVIADVAKKMVFRAQDLEKRGAARDGWTVKLSSEYDCQNLFYTVVKPWIGRVGREEVAIKFDKQEKRSDFNLFGSQLIIEMKFIDSDHKKREVVKTLDGLSGFYKLNANVRVLLFLIYVRSSIAVDGCDPQSPWQRGSNENTNGLLRHYMPKGIDISGYSQPQLDPIARQLNERPRKTLGFQTPAEMSSASVASTG